MWNKILNYCLANIDTIIATGSAIFAFFQAREAKKSLKMQQKIYNDGMANFEFEDILNSFVYSDENCENIYYFFKINVKNLSDKNTSIHKIKLKIIGRNNIFIVECEENLQIENKLERMKVPCNIQSHSAVSGWVVFGVPRSVYKEINIDTHYIILEDIHGLLKKKEEISVFERRVEYEK